MRNKIILKGLLIVLSILAIWDISTNGFVFLNTIPEYVDVPESTFIYYEDQYIDTSKTGSLQHNVSNKSSDFVLRVSSFGELTLIGTDQENISYRYTIIYPRQMRKNVSKISP